MEFFEHREAFIRDGDDADIRLDGGERIVRRKGRFLGGQGVKECRFSNVGQANDTDGEAHARRV